MNGQRLRWNAIAHRVGGGFTRVLVDGDGRILAASAVSCVWSGSTLFDRWFRRRWLVVRIEQMDTAQEAV